MELMTKSRHLLPLASKKGCLTRIYSCRNAGFLSADFILSLSAFTLQYVVPTPCLLLACDASSCWLRCQPRLKLTWPFNSSLSHNSKWSQLPHSKIPKKTGMVPAILSCAGPHSGGQNAGLLIEGLPFPSVQLSVVRVRVKWTCHSPAWASN